MTYQLKILATAVLSVVILKKSLTTEKSADRDLRLGCGTWSAAFRALQLQLENGISGAATAFGVHFGPCNCSWKAAFRAL